MAANLAKTSVPKNFAKVPAPLAIPGSTKGSLDASHVAGLIARTFAVFKAPPPTHKAGFNKTFLPTTPNAGPTNGNKPPIMAPSAPKRNLFLKLAATLSLPDNSEVSSYSPTSFEDINGSSNISDIVLYGPPATKSPTPKEIVPVPTRLATFEICTPSFGNPSRAYVFCVNRLTLPPDFANISFLNLFITLNATPPGIPNSIASAPICPKKVSGLFKSASS